MKLIHLAPNTASRIEIHRTGLHANDAYSAYLEMGSPKNLSPEQIAHLNDLTRDAPERDEVVRSSRGGDLEIGVAMNSNDVVLIKVQRSRK